MQVNQFKDRADQLLQQGIRELSMTLGVLARIENNTYEIAAVQSNSGAYVAGEKYTLGNSYSRDVSETKRTIAAVSIDNSPLTLHHPLYRSLPLECYIGAPVVVAGETWGCIDFSSMAQRDHPFSAEEIELINTLAAEISTLIDSNAYAGAR